MHRTAIAMTLSAACFFPMQALAFNAEANCEDIIVNAGGLSALAATSDRLRSANQEDLPRLKSSMTETIFVLLFQAKFDANYDAEIKAMKARLVSCVNGWSSGTFPVGKPPRKIIADAEKDLDAVRANLEAALVESEKKRSAELAEQTRIQADAEASEKDEQTKIAELEEKVREAEAAKKKSSEASQQRQALEQRLADAHTPDATPRPTESGGQKKLEVLSAYFQQFTVAKMCADADFRFSKDDIDKLQEGISKIIDHEKIDSEAVRVMWDRISTQLNAAKASLRETDCNDAAQWFRFSMPNVQLGKADPFPFAK